MKIINIHVGSDMKLDTKYDELFANNGSIAALLQIEKECGIVDRYAVDLSISGNEGLSFIEKQILNNQEPVVCMFSVLDYNAENTLKYIDELKKKFGTKAFVVVGGQLIPFVKEAYQNNTNIDIVSIGDGEVLVPKILQDLNSGKFSKTYEIWVKDLPVGHRKFAPLDYDGYFGIEDFLNKQKKEAKESQLVVQLSGGPGCSWAANNVGGACKFCALQNITTMNDSSIEEMLVHVKSLEDKYHLDRFFDVANQFLPYINRNKAKEWLKKFIKVKKELGIKSGFFVYLTIASVDEEIVGLLKEAGVVGCFIGVDHFEKDVLREQNKQAAGSDSIREKTFRLLSEKGIEFELGIVLGSTSVESKESMEAVKVGVKSIYSKYSKSFNAVSFSPVEVIQGSKVWDEFAYKIENPTKEIIDLAGFDKAKKAMLIFKEKGFFTRRQKILINRFYMRINGVDPDIIYEFEKEMCDWANNQGIFVSSATSPDVLTRVKKEEERRSVSSFDRPRVRG